MTTPLHQYEVYTAYWSRDFNRYALGVVVRDLVRDTTILYISDGCVRHLDACEKVYIDNIRSLLGMLKYEFEQSPLNLDLVFENFSKYPMSMIYISPPRKILHVEDIIEHCRKGILFHDNYPESA